MANRLDAKHESLSAAMLETPAAETRKVPRAFPWLPHEVVFGSFLLVTWLRLTAGLGWTHPCSLIFLGCLAGALAVPFWARNEGTSFQWRTRLLYYPVVMGITFFTLGHAIRALGVPRVDELLLRWDRALLGETPGLSFQPWSRPWLNDLLMLGYLFFFYQLIAVPAAYFIRDLPRFRQCIVGLFTVYGLGFLSYTLLPAGGPHRWMSFDTPLEGPVFIRWFLGAVNSGSNGVDVFPSLHFGVSLYLLVFDWWHSRRRFWWMLAPCVIMWLSTVLLRFHYFVDLPGGLAVALCGLFVARRFARRELQLK